MTSVLVDRIAWAGPSASAPPADSRLDVGGRSVIPSFVDPELRDHLAASYTSW